MKLNYKRTFLVGLAFMTIGSFWQLYDGVVPLILKNTFGISDTVTGIVMAADNVLALILLPLFGTLSDKTNSRLGRRMPYILIGTVLAVISMMFIPVSNNMKSFALLFIALGITLLAMSSYRSASVALMPDVTPKPLRSKANAVINLMGAVGGIFALAAVGLLVPKGDNPNYIPVFAVIAGFMIIAVFFLVFTIQERKLVKDIDAQVNDEKARKSSEVMPPEVKRSFYFILASVFLWFMGYNAVTTAFSRYAQVYWGLEGGLFAYTLIVAQVAAIIAFIPVGIIASKVGRKKTILFGLVLLAIAFISAAFFKSFSTMLFFFFAVAGVGWASINVNSYPMVVEMSRSADVGKYTGIYYTFSMSAQIVTPILSGALLDYVGYWTLFPYGTLFGVLAFVTMLFVKHGDNKPAAVKNIEAYDSMDD
ncbi:MAG: MFS transporter [Clostridia bacterium]|nr:MFS transporter [Clostridia bacterium]